MLFEVAIVEMPTKKDLEEGAIEKLVFGPKYVIAKDANAASIKAVLDGGQNIPEFNMDRSTVLVRPFVQ
jgi:hypothetical protein